MPKRGARLRRPRANSAGCLANSSIASSPSGVVAAAGRPKIVAARREVAAASSRTTIPRAAINRQQTGTRAPTDRPAQKSSSGALAIRSDGKSTGRRQIDRCRRRSVSNRSEHIDLEVSKMASDDPSAWEFTALRRRAEAMLPRADTALERGQVRLILNRIARFEDVKRRNDLINQSAGAHRHRQHPTPQSCRPTNRRVTTASAN